METKLKKALESTWPFKQLLAVLSPDLRKEVLVELARKLN